MKREMAVVKASIKEKNGVIAVLSMHGVIVTQLPQRRKSSGGGKKRKRIQRLMQNVQVIAAEKCLYFRSTWMCSSFLQW